MLMCAVAASANTQSRILFVAWKVQSDLKAGTAVQVSNNDFVDWGWLQPPSTLELKAPLISLATGKPLVPEGMRLAKMQGDLPGAAYCTWNQGKQPWAENDVNSYFLTARGPLVCVEPDSEGMVTSATCFSANDFLLMNGYKIDFCKNPGKVKPVGTRFMSGLDYPHDIRFGVALRMQKGRPPCLVMATRVRSHSDTNDFSENVCFKGTSNSISFSRAKYTLINFNNETASIIVDNPLSMENLRLTVKREFRLVPY